MLRVKDIRNAARHSGRKVASCFSKDDHRAARHILAAVVTHALNNRRRTGIAHAKAFTCNAGDKRTAAGCAVKRNVANNHILRRLKYTRRVSADNQLTAGESLSEIIVAVAGQRKRHAFW